MQRYNLCKPEKYEKNGEEKTAWKNVGTLVIFEKDGNQSMIVEIPAIGLKANAFPMKTDNPF